ncbi:PaaI family thioesterase [Mycobacterium sp. DL592]|uniref:PaaI family thioesterase n=1 Tax=Mycobacterium sp. DL592 TaxID=2675524 RepID=UPI00141ED8B6|nr:PaaI family thioesterase [Mycobacterium sp. DL592]
MDVEWDFISADEYDRIKALHQPLAEAVRRLVDASLHSGADEETILAARQTIDEVSEMLERTPADGPRTLRHAETGLPVVWRNPAVGQHNPLAPPMTTHHDGTGRCWSEFTLGPVYEGPPGLVHGGICALLLDQLLGEVATNQLSMPKFTGTITLKYLRGTPLGPLRAQAWVERTEGHKTYARGTLGDAQGTTVEAEGVFIMPAWARVATG